MRKARFAEFGIALVSVSLMATPAFARDVTQFRDKDAIAFVTRLAFDAEAADHHPDILINYKRVTLTFSTHSAGGLTEKDFAGARKVDALV